MPNPAHSSLLRRLCNDLLGKRTVAAVVAYVGADRWAALWAAATVDEKARMIQMVAKSLDKIERRRLRIGKGIPPKRPWTPELWAEFGRLVEAGADDAVIAESVGLTADAVRAWKSEWRAGRRHIPGRAGRKPSPGGKERWEKVGKLVEANAARRPKEVDAIIAKELGITVRDAAKRRSRWKRGKVDKYMREGAPA